MDDLQHFVDDILVSLIVKMYIYIPVEKKKAAGLKWKFPMFKRLAGVFNNLPIHLTKYWVIIKIINVCVG